MWQICSWRARRLGSGRWLFGLAPAWRAGRADPQSAMKSRGRGVAVGHSRFNMGKALVVVQIALSLVLVAGAGLLMSSWRRLATTNPSFRQEGVVLARIVMRSAGIADSLLPGVYRQVLDRVRAAPGVLSASESNVTPIGGDTWNNGIEVTGYSPANPDDAIVLMNEVSDGFFATLGTPFLLGRDFDARDRPGTAKVAIVTEAFARRFFGTTPAVGRQFRLQEGRGYGPPFEIVGVVKDMKYEQVREQSSPIAFFAHGQNATPRRSVSVEVRVRGDAAASIPAIRSLLIEMNPRFTLELGTLDRQIGESLRLPLALAMLSGFFGALALALASIGLYGIMSYSIAQRRNEIGVRIALGAARTHIIRLVLGEVGRMVVAGVAIGALIAVGATKFVTAFLYGVKPTDPATLGLSALALVAVGLVAAALPAARAARLDPVEALRED